MLNRIIIIVLSAVGFLGLLSAMLVSLSSMTEIPGLLLPPLNYLTAQLLVYPYEGEKSSGSLLLSSLLFVTAAVCVAESLTGSDMPVVTVMTVAEGAVLAVDLMLRILVTYEKVVKLFNNTSLLNNMHLNALSIYVCLFEADLLLTSSLGTMPGNIAVLILSAGLAALCLRRIIGRRAFVFIASKEKELRTLLKGNLRDAPDENDMPDRKMSALYKRIINYMEERTPYLNPDMDLDEFSRNMFTNKVYLSRTVNIYSGRNFRQFVNWYRVEHAIRLMKENPRGHIEEISFQSGFRSSSSFNMAFKLYKGVTPREWLEQYREDLEHLSRKKEKEQ